MKQQERQIFQLVKFLYASF